MQHVADTLCYMFCGWRLVNSYQELELLHSGTLVIDVRTEACRFEGRDLVPLRIAGELKAWYDRELLDNRIDAGAIREAMLVAELTFGTKPCEKRKKRNVDYSSDSAYVTADHFITCDIHCSSRIITDEREYTSEYTDFEVWPPGWPESG